MATKKQKQQFYLGNENLPTSDALFDWDSNPAWVEDLVKCKRNILYFSENFFYITNLDEGKIKIRLHNFQKRILRSLRDHRFVITLASRQIPVLAKSLEPRHAKVSECRVSCFQDDQRLLVVANKEATAINILKRIRMAYEKLPNYLKPGVTEWGKTSVVFANGSSIGISTTSSDAGRGDSCNCVDGNTMVTLRDKKTLLEFQISMYDLTEILKDNGEMFLEVVDE